MRADDPALIAFAEDLRQEILTEAELPDQELMRSEVFTRRMIDVLIEAGEVEDALPAYHRGRGVEVAAYGVDDDDTLNLVVTEYRGDVPPTSVTRTQIDTAFRRLEAFWTRCSTAPYHEDLEESSDAYDMARHVHQVARRIRRLRLFVVTDGLSAVEFLPPSHRDGVELQRAIWDIGRLFRLQASGRGREPVDVDLAADHGGPIPCLGTGEAGEDYSAFLASVPGRILADIYEQHGARLLELNVRSFLQAAGKVNRGIRDTLLHAPERFLAYNNGISATAAGVDLVALPQGGTGIARIRDLQIVNGGQTTASVHRLRGQADLERVAVQAKITVIDPERLDEIVPLISRFANSQNKVQEADLSANHPFHVQLESLSRTLWAPASGDTLRQTRWFYERARGSYADALNRESTPGRRKAFRAVHPPTQKFTKTDVAKFENTWDQLPHEVSRGAQKNFTVFMGRVRDRGLTPDAAHFERLVAKAILFRGTEKIVTEQQFGGFRANIVTYTIAKLSHATAQRVDLGGIWERQALSATLQRAIAELSHLAYNVIAERTPSGANVTEWSKRPQCWTLLREERWDLPRTLADELVDRALSGRIRGAPAGGRRTEEEQRVIERASRPGGHGWLAISHWAKQTDNLSPWQRRFAYTIGVQLKRGRELSVKQAVHARQILDVARGLGFDPSAGEQTAGDVKPTSGESSGPTPTSSGDQAFGPAASAAKGETAPIKDDGAPAVDEDDPGKPGAHVDGSASGGGSNADPEQAQHSDEILLVHVLSPRTANCLRRAGFRTLSEVAECTASDLHAIHTLGRKGLAEIEDVLTAQDMRLSQAAGGATPETSDARSGSAPADGGDSPAEIRAARGRGPRRDTTRDDEVARLRAEGLTLQAIADQVGVTRERVRQILVAAGRDLDNSYLAEIRRDQRLDAARARAAELLEGFRAGRPIAEVAAELGVAAEAADDVVQTIASPADRAERGSNSGRGVNGPTYTDEDLLDAIRRVAAELDAVPSAKDYGRLAGRLALPSLPTIHNRLGGWAAAVRQTGMTPHQAQRTYTRMWDEQKCWNALVRLVEELGEVPTVDHYNALSATRDDLPSSATVRNRLGRWSDVAARLARGDQSADGGA